MTFAALPFIEIWPSLGEPQAFPTPTSKPKFIKICGDEIQLPKQTWRQVTIQCCEWVIKNRSDSFETARILLKSHFRDNMQDKSRCHQLSNGFWVYVNKSESNHREFSRRFLAAVGISEADWSIEYVSD